MIHCIFSVCLFLLLTFPLAAQTLPVKSRQSNVVQSTKSPPNVPLRYPEKAYKNNIQGTVKVQVSFDQNCLITQVVLIEGIGHGCDEEAIKYIKANHQQLEEQARAKAKLLAPSPTGCECEEHSIEILIRFRILGIEDQ